MLEQELTYQSPEKKQQRPRNHRVDVISPDKAILRADSLTDLAAGVGAVRFL